MYTHSLNVTRIQRSEVYMYVFKNVGTMNFNNDQILLLNLKKN